MTLDSQFLLSNNYLDYSVLLAIEKRHREEAEPQVFQAPDAPRASLQSVCDNILGGFGAQSQ